MEFTSTWNLSYERIWIRSHNEVEPGSKDTDTGTSTTQQHKQFLKNFNMTWWYDTSMKRVQHPK